MNCSCSYTHTLSTSTQIDMNHDFEKSLQALVSQQQTSSRFWTLIICFVRQWLKVKCRTSRARRTCKKWFGTTNLLLGHNSGLTNVHSNTIRAEARVSSIFSYTIIIISKLFSMQHYIIVITCSSIILCYMNIEYWCWCCGFDEKKFTNKFGFRRSIHNGSEFGNNMVHDSVARRWR